jgi:ribose 5-phosphate isomerase B
MKIALTNDHAASEMHERLVEHIREKGHEVLDLGTSAPDRVDYPLQAERAARAVLDGRADRAVLVCGTGIGMSIAANKFPGIRCALCTDLFAAELCRLHNNANVLALRGRNMDVQLNCRIIDAFLETEFEGDRHQRRLDLITEIEHKTKEM